MGAGRFDRFLPLAGVLTGLLFFVGLALNRSDPSSETPLPASAPNIQTMPAPAAKMASQVRNGRR